MIPTETQPQCAEAAAASFDDLLRLRGAALSPSCLDLIVKRCLGSGGHSSANSLVHRAVVSALRRLAGMHLRGVVKCIVSEVMF